MYNPPENIFEHMSNCSCVYNTLTFRNSQYLIYIILIYIDVGVKTINSFAPISMAPLSQHMSKNKKTVGGVPHIQGTPPTVQDDPFTTNTFSHHNTVNYHQIR